MLNTAVARAWKDALRRETVHLIQCARCAEAEQPSRRCKVGRGLSAVLSAADTALDRHLSLDKLKLDKCSRCGMPLSD